MRSYLLAGAIFLNACCSLGIMVLHAEEKWVVVRPQLISDVLNNPGIGFTTFQRFNDDPLNPGKEWSEGFPIVKYGAEKINKIAKIEHPTSAIAYYRINWRFVEPNEGKYAWDLIDAALNEAKEHKQTLMLRVAPHGPEEDADVPDWFRAMLATEGSEQKLLNEAWRVNPESPIYRKYFSRMIRSLAKRYDGHADLELIDVAIVGNWGEGAGSDILSDSTREELLAAYFESFNKTLLLIQPTDSKVVAYAQANSQNFGWRVDCLGDVGGFSPTWSHMLDLYPQQLVQNNLQNNWQTGPVAMEACWVMKHWQENKWDLQYIIDQSLKWHISSFNNKSSVVPAEWKTQVDAWLNKMGYRLALRKWTHPEQVKLGGAFNFTSWWENLGVAPCYQEYPLAIRLKNNGKDMFEKIFLTSADIRKWLPGDSLFNSAVTIPEAMPIGRYDVSIALLEPTTRQARIKLAIAGRAADGWYSLGSVEVVP